MRGYMGFNPDQVSTVTFDSYSTLVDVDAAEKALAARPPAPVRRSTKSFM